MAVPFDETWHQHLVGIAVIDLYLAEALISSSGPTLRTRPS